MVTETVEAPQAALPLEEGANLAPQTVTQTEIPDGDAVAPAEEAVASKPDDLQVEAPKPAPEGLSREEVERLIEEKSGRIKAEALEEDRNRRRTEEARRVQAEERAKKRLQQTVDTVKTALVARGLDPEVVTEESVVVAIDRVAQERAESILGDNASLVGSAWDYMAATITGEKVERDESFAPILGILAPKVQRLIDSLVPSIEAEARKGYIPESELPARVEAEITRRNAQKREGTEELKRPDGAPASTVMSWEAYQRLSDAEKLAMPPAQRQQIMAEDRKRRLGQ